MKLKIKYFDVMKQVNWNSLVFGHNLKIKVLNQAVKNQMFVTPANSS